MVIKGTHLDEGGNPLSSKALILMREAIHGHQRHSS